jgi:hypothetical protein
MLQKKVDVNPIEHRFWTETVAAMEENADAYMHADHWHS